MRIRLGPMRVADVAAATTRSSDPPAPDASASAAST
jgi:hypothetical protein